MKCLGCAVGIRREVLLSLRICLSLSLSSPASLFLFPYLFRTVCVPERKARTGLGNIGIFSRCVRICMCTRSQRAYTRAHVTYRMGKRARCVVSDGSSRPCFLYATSSGSIVSKTVLGEMYVLFSGVSSVRRARFPPPSRRAPL